MLGLLVATFISSIGPMDPKGESQVISRGGATWINGSSPIGWGKDVECTYAGTVAAALKDSGIDVTYDQVMAASGLAFRVRWWHYDGSANSKMWCPSTPVGEFPDEIAATQKTLGIRMKVIDEMASESKTPMVPYVDEFKKSIKSGVGVCAYPDSVDLNMALVFGFTENNEWMVKTYSSGKTVFIPFDKLGPLALVIDPSGFKLKHSQLAKAAIGLAVGHLTRKPNGSYLYGLEALKAWRDDIAKADKYNDKEKQTLFFVSWWNYGSWFDARCSVSRYLHSESKLVGGKLGEAMEKAALVYDEEVKLLSAGFMEKNAFLGPWSGKEMKDWDEKTRIREMDVLAKAMKLESEAVECLKSGTK